MVKEGPKETQELESALSSSAAPPAAEGEAAAEADAEQKLPQAESINFLVLLYKGGWMMIPIGGMLVLAITFSIERGLALRRSKVLPAELTEQLGRLTQRTSSFDPRQVYRVCQQYPCATSNIIRAMLLKIGRPHAEVERAVAEATEREANLAYGNVRWLHLCVAVAPMLGLLGTVWGMIDTFYQTANLPEHANKLQILAGGIYVALVTTFGGLVVAIPSAAVAHFYEVRIQALFHEINELLSSLLPLVEQYEGRLRVQAEHLVAEVVESPAKESATREPQGARL